MYANSYVCNIYILHAIERLLLLLTTFIYTVDSNCRWSFRRHFYKIQCRDETVVIER